MADTQWFTGTVRISPVDSSARTRIDSVRFAAGARTGWHRHPLGQLLVITEGTGLVQRRGAAAETVRAGDTVRVEPNEWHWHGATESSSMTHLAVEEIPEDRRGTEFDRPVTEQEYRDSQVPIDRVTVLDEILPAAWATHRVEIRRISIAPGQPAGLHVHNCPVFGSIESGSVVYQIEGGPESVLTEGDLFHEPAQVRIARFDALEQGVTFLAYFLLGAGQTPELEFPGRFNGS